MDNEAIYRKAIGLLWEKTYGSMEHDEEKAIELFDKLLDKGIKIHCNKIKQICVDVGYTEGSSRRIGGIYDIISLYKDYRKGIHPTSWRDEDIENLLNL